jgi:hypothetical protein
VRAGETIARSEEARMTRALAAVALVLLASPGGCVRSTGSAADLEARYYLSEDVHKYSSESFTGFVSAWLTGPEKVETICPASIPVAGSTVLEKGSPVRILEILEVSGVDASHSEAKLQIADVKSGASYVVYVRWPGSKPLLTTEPPSAHPQPVVR